MINYEAPSSKAALKALEDVPTRRRLLQYAQWFTHSVADAEDLFGAAEDLVFDPDEGRPWDPTRGSIRAHMCILIRDLARQQRRSARARREILDPGYAFDESMASPNPGPEQALSDARELEEYRRMGGLVREGLEQKSKRRAVEVFDARGRGIESVEELAGLLGCDAAAVYEANRLIGREAARVKTQEQKAAAERMNLRRLEAKRKETP